MNMEKLVYYKINKKLLCKLYCFYDNLRTFDLSLVINPPHLKLLSSISFLLVVVSTLNTLTIYHSRFWLKDHKDASKSKKQKLSVTKKEKLVSLSHQLFNKTLVDNLSQFCMTVFSCVFILLATFVVEKLWSVWHTLYRSYHKFFVYKINIYFL